MVVSKVVTDSRAQTQGVREGDCVVGVEDDWVLGYRDFVQRVSTATFPLTLILRRQA